MNNKYKRLGKNIFYVFLGNTGSKVLNILLLPFYTSWLSVEDYGVTDLLNVYVTLLLGLCTASIAEAAFVFPKDRDANDQKSYFSSGLFSSLLILVVSLFIFLGFSQVFLKLDILPTFSNYVWQIFLMILATFFNTYFQEFNRGLDKIKVYSTSGVIFTLCSALFAFLMIPQWGVNGYIYAIIFANLCAAIYSAILSRSFSYISFKAFSKKHYMEMLKYSVPLIPNSIMWWFIGYFNRPLIESYAGLDAVGILAVSNKFPTAIVMLFAVFFYSWQVSVIEEYGKSGYKEFYNKVFRLLLLVLCLASIALGVLSKYIVAIFTTSEFHEAWVYIPLLAIAPLFQAISSFSSTNFTAVKNTKYIFYASVIGGAASVLLNFLLIPLYGIWGAVLSILLSHLLMALARVYYAWRYVKLTHILLTSLTLLVTILSAVSISFIQNVLYKFLVVFGLVTILLIANRQQLLMIIEKIKIIYGNYIRRDKE